MKRGIGMKTIAERATEFVLDANDFNCDNCATCGKCKDYRKFVDIVTEQKTIDIERAVLWFRSRSEYPFSKLEDSFRTFMEKE